MTPLSAEWKSSDWLERELLYAQGQRKPVLLVEVEPMQPSLLVVGRLVINYANDPADGLSTLDEALRSHGL